MSTKEIIRAIKHLPVNERLMIIEESVHTIRNESNGMVQEAVELLYHDYKTDKEFTSFTSLDMENFYEAK